MDLVGTFIVTKLAVEAMRDNTPLKKVKGRGREREGKERGKKGEKGKGKEREKNTKMNTDIFKKVVDVNLVGTFITPLKKVRGGGGGGWEGKRGKKGGKGEEREMVNYIYF